MSDQSATIQLHGDTGGADITVVNVDPASQQLGALFTDLAKVAADLAACAPGSTPPPPPQSGPQPAMRPAHR
jgi:hypothetical protein